MSFLSDSTISDRKNFLKFFREALPLIREELWEIFKEDIARNRIVLTTETEEDPMGMVRSGQAPSLNALRLHNGTVYRWNRPCYGVHNNVAHLRIENRVIPSGPTVADEMANAAFFFGMMAGMASQYPDIRQHLRFEEPGYFHPVGGNR